MRSTQQPQPIVAVLADGAKLGDMIEVLESCSPHLPVIDLLTSRQTLSSLAEAVPQPIGIATHIELAYGIVNRKINLVVAFYTDESSPNRALAALAEQYDVPLGLNPVTAEILIRHLGARRRASVITVTHPSVMSPRRFPWDSPFARIPERETP